MVRNPNNYKKKIKKKFTKTVVSYKDVVHVRYSVYPSPLFSEKASEFSLKSVPALTIASISL